MALVHKHMDKHIDTISLKNHDIVILKNSSYNCYKIYLALTNSDEINSIYGPKSHDKILYCRETSGDAFIFIDSLDENGLINYGHQIIEIYRNPEYNKKFTKNQIKRYGTDTNLVNLPKNRNTVKVWSIKKVKI